jgi:hypothetical protein
MASFKRASERLGKTIKRGAAETRSAARAAKKDGSALAGDVRGEVKKAAKTTKKAGEKMVEGIRRKSRTYTR